MKLFGRMAKVEGRTPECVRRALSCVRHSTFDIRHSSRAFTLIEIMVAVGILAVILTIGIPFFARQMHEDSMRKAVADITDLCRETRNRAVLSGQPMELRIRPVDKTFSIAAGTAAVATTGGTPVGEGAGDSSADGGPTTRKLSDHILIEWIGINLHADLQLEEQTGIFFYANGTSDEAVMVLRSDRGEVRRITIEPVTGQIEVDVEGKR
jgi:prepilin-type N-terminal cleavage/methylation domain-containing protein